MGRTGRKRDGKIVVLVTEGAEERAYNQSVVNRKAIQKAMMEKDKLEQVMFAGIDKSEGSMRRQCLNGPITLRVCRCSQDGPDWTGASVSGHQNDGKKVGIEESRSRI